MIVQVDIPENKVKQRALFLDMIMSVNAFVLVPNISAMFPPVAQAIKLASSFILKL